MINMRRMYLTISSNNLMKYFYWIIITPLNPKNNQKFKNNQLRILKIKNIKKKKNDFLII